MKNLMMALLVSALAVPMTAAAFYQSQGEVILSKKNSRQPAPRDCDPREESYECSGNGGGGYDGDGYDDGERHDNDGGDYDGGGHGGGYDGDGGYYGGNGF